MPLHPSQYGTASILELLREAERGWIGFDQRLIRELIGRREETLDALEEFLKTEHEERLVDLTEPVFDLYRSFRTPRALPFYLELLKKRGETVPDVLLEALAGLGQAAVEPLLQLHAGAPADDRPDIVFVLSALGVRDARIQRLIEDALATDAYEGSLCAGLYGDPALEPAVRAALAQIPPDRTQASERRVLEECLESLQAERAAEEPEPYEILAEYPPEAAPLFDYLPAEEALLFFDSPEADYRLRAALSFCDEEYTEETRGRLAGLARHDPAAAVRGAALRALGGRAHEPGIRALLMDTLRASGCSLEERRGALIALASLAGEPEARQALLDAVERPETRAAALQAMWRSFDRRFARHIVLALQSKDPEVLREAIHGIGAYPLEDQAACLVPLFENEELREEALFSYALAVGHPTTPKGVHRLFEMIAGRAGGLSGDEEEAVAAALDQRLMRAGYEPVFFPGEDEEHAHKEAPEAGAPAGSGSGQRPGRNDPCPCGSGKKYKKCCGAAGS